MNLISKFVGLMFVAAFFAPANAQQVRPGLTYITVDGCTSLVSEALLRNGVTVSWSGACKDGYAEGQGVRRYYDSSRQLYIILIGEMSHGQFRVIESVSKNLTTNALRYSKEVGTPSTPITPDQVPNWAREIVASEAGAGKQEPGQAVAQGACKVLLFNEKSTIASPYKGGCKDGLADGQGSYSFGGPPFLGVIRTVKGEFHNGKLNGQVTITDQAGAHQEQGEFRDNKNWNATTRIVRDNGIISGAEFRDGTLFAICNSNGQNERNCTDRGRLLATNANAPAQPGVRPSPPAQVQQSVPASPSPQSPKQISLGTGGGFGGEYILYHLGDSGSVAGVSFWELTFGPNGKCGTYGGHVVGIVPQSVNLLDDSLARSLLAEGKRVFPEQCPGNSVGLIRLIPSTYSKTNSNPPFQPILVEADTNYYKNFVVMAAQQAAENRRQEQIQRASDQKLQSFAAKYGASGWIKWDVLRGNPFALEGKVYLFNPRFARMETPTSGIFSAGTFGETLFSDVPRSAFGSPVDVVMAGKVLGSAKVKNQFGAEVSMPHVKYLGHVTCNEATCNGYLSGHLK